MTASFRDMKSPAAAHSTPSAAGLLIRLHAPFFLLQTGLVNEREMDVWIEAVMAPFLLILPLLASLRYLTQASGKWDFPLRRPFTARCNDDVAKKKEKSCDGI